MAAMSSGIFRYCRSRDFFICKYFQNVYYCNRAPSSGEECKAAKFEETAKKLREKTPIGRLDELEGQHPFQEKEPLPPFPGGINPKTGEINGPRGPEPTRYGDWERKGRVSDF